MPIDWPRRPRRPIAQPQPRYAVEVRWDVRIPVRDGLELSANLWLPARPRADATRTETLPGHPRDDPVRQGQLAPERGRRPGASGWRRAASRCAGSTSAARAPRPASPWTSTPRPRPATGTTPSSGSPPSRGAAAASACGASAGAGSRSIQVAKLRPPHLRAILPMYATDDRYRDDVHIRGGCVTASEKSQYAVSQLGMNAMPPLPAFRGEGWRDEWRARLEQTPPWLFAWIREQTDGPYWRRGSLAPDYDGARVRGLPGRRLERLVRGRRRSGSRSAAPTPRVRTLVGNWVHSFPDDAYPGPNLDWLHEMVRFFDRYLKGIDNGWEREPAMTWFEHEWAEPEPFPREWPGRWRAAGGVPGARGDRAVDAAPGAGGVAGDDDAGRRRDGVRAIRHRATVGHLRGPVLGRGLAPERPRARPAARTRLRGAHLHDRRRSRSRCRSSASRRPCSTSPRRCPSRRASSACRRSRPTGSRRWSRRASSTSPTGARTRTRSRWSPGRVEEVRIPLRATGYRFSPGHRIRLTVLTGYWPVLWPSPLPGELHVHHGPADAVAARSCPVLPDDVASARAAGVQDDARRPARRRRQRGGRRPSGGSRRTSSAGRSP